MINLVFRNILRFFLFVLLQVLILNNIYLSGYINPFLYVLFILLLPINIPGWGLLLISFATGLSVDMFSDTGGLHAAAAVVLGFCRPYVIKFLSPRDGYEYIAEPTLDRLSITWFVIYVSSLVLLHHFILFNLEMFRFSELGFTITKVFFSSAVTIILVFITLFLFYKKAK